MTVVDITLRGYKGLDYYDISMNDGMNLRAGVRRYNFNNYYCPTQIIFSDRTSKRRGYWRQVKLQDIGMSDKHQCSVP